ncbi:MAG: hypothetical protein R3310_03270 [Candidatus Competibacteraceae bacterium]|nr:hypothetical protein [Candidatus Competibacteraceae bacterium]
MAEANLFEIEAVDEFHGTEARPSQFLRSLPAQEQLSRVEEYLRCLDSEYKLASDEAEKARVAILRNAARKYLDNLQ